MDGLNAGAATFTPGGATPPVDPAAPEADMAAGPGHGLDENGQYMMDPYGAGGGGGYIEDTSENNAMLDEIEAEIEAQQQQQSGPTGGGPPSSGGAPPVMYTDLPPHADEFWFPECRNCTCCNGYKHGCQCCAKEGLRSCKCAPSTGPTSNAAAAPPPQQQPGGWMPAQPGPGTGGGGGNYGGGQGGGGGGRGHYGGGRGGGGRGRGGNPPPCRFFNSPSGCRFGDNCRFSHSG